MRTIEQVRCYLKMRDGWIKTFTNRLDRFSFLEPGVLAPDSRLTIAFSDRESTYGAIPYEYGLVPRTSDSFSRRDFFLVRSSRIVDYKKNEIRFEAWFEER